MSFIFETIISLLIIFANNEPVSASRVMSLNTPMTFEGKLEKADVLHHNKTVVCILDSWSRKRVPESAFELKSIDTSLCSQIVCRNAEINKINHTIEIRDDENKDPDWFRQVVELSKSPSSSHLKVLLSVGGYLQGSEFFSDIAADPNKRNSFVQSVVKVLDEYGFHGMDFAWEYPGWVARGGKPEDKSNLPLLLKDLRDAFTTGKYLLTLSVAGDTRIAEGAYDFEAISEFVDQFNLRAFDFNGNWGEKAYHHAALLSSDSGEGQQSFESTIHFYLEEKGVVADKIVVGVPFYGRTMVLMNDTAYVSLNASDNNMTKFSGLGQPIVKSEGFAGKWIPDDKSRVGYHELCQNFTKSESDWIRFLDNYCQAPFARSGLRWVSYDDPDSIKLKVQKMMEKGLKGMMAWSIDTDDFKGIGCASTHSNDVSENNDESNAKTYPMLRTINYAIAEFQDETVEVNAKEPRIDSTVVEDNREKSDTDKPTTKPETITFTSASNSVSYNEYAIIGATLTCLLSKIISFF